MIFSNNNKIKSEPEGHFPGVVEVLKSAGVKGKSLEYVDKWLNVSEERDYELLKKIDLQADRAVIEKIKNSKFWNVLDKDFRACYPGNNDFSEINRRVKLLGCKLLGYHGWILCYNSHGAWDDYSYAENLCLEFEKETDMFDETDAYLSGFFRMAAHSFEAERYSYVRSDFTLKRDSEYMLAAAKRAFDQDPSMAAMLAGAAVSKFDVPDENLISEACDLVLKAASKNTELHTLIGLCAVYPYRNEIVKKYGKEIYKNKLQIIFKMNASPFDDNRVYDIFTLSDDIFEIDELKQVLTFIFNGNKKNNTDFLIKLAAVSPDKFIKLCTNSCDIGFAKDVNSILKQAVPSKALDDDTLRSKARDSVSRAISDCFDERVNVYSYLEGKIPYSEVKGCISDMKKSYDRNKNNGYYSYYGDDDYIVRLFTLLTQYNITGYSTNPLYSFVGFNLRDGGKILASVFDRSELSADEILTGFSNSFDSLYSTGNFTDDFSEYFAEHTDRIKDADVMSADVNARIMYLKALSPHPNKYRAQILAMTGDTSKAIKEILVKILSEMKDINAEIEEMIVSKKSAVRDLALSVIEKKGSNEFKEALEKQFEKEKSEKIKNRIELLVSGKVTQHADSSSEDAVSSLAGGSKAKKVAWLFEVPFTPVKMKNDVPVDDTYLKALLMCYAEEAGVKNLKADKLAEELNEKDLTNFAHEVFGKWYDKGCEAKTKWVLYFTAVYGGHAAIENYVKLIKEWAEAMRSALAGEAVKALAMNGSSEALLIVDNMARKFKNKQVKRCANEAMDKAADVLGITKEELADKIVPDLGFDEKMCRVFDYGPRQFNVYITKDLKPEVYCGEKKFKDMPKPGASDDKEKAEKAYAEYKDMKKLMKTVIAAQTDRLEYVLMCDRKWTAAGFDALFVKNPVMHCFAEGLVWGAYENGSLVQTFRYMDDGSFTTVDEDEYELPENAEIGIVHPVELDEEVLDSWKEQLEDYEITQPFEQLCRKVYLPEENELEKTQIDRFLKKKFNCLSLNGKMLKYNWAKGMAQDAGIFYEYYHTDIAGKKTDENGKETVTGYISEMNFSGMYIQVSYEDNEDVELEGLKFYDAGDLSFKKPLKIKDVNIKYFSEVIRQMMIISGSEEK